MNSFAKKFIGMHAWIYQKTGGRLGGSMGGSKVLVLNTKGAKSGRLLSNPVMYFDVPEGYLVVASAGGQAKNPAWFYNLKANPVFEIQVMEKVIPVKAEIVSGERRAALWKQVVDSAPNFEQYQKSTPREIPLVVLVPQAQAK